MSDKEAEAPITAGMVLRWSGFVAAIMTAVVSACFAYSSLRSDLDAVKVENLNQKKYFEDRRTFTDSRFLEVEKKFVETNTAVKLTDSMTRDLQRKLDVAVALLERIDSKLGKP